MDNGLAYTTVLTILIRLWRKGLLERPAKAGHAYTYRPAVSEADYAAQHMEAALTRARDRAAVLNRFVGNLSARDAAVLRDLLEGSRRSVTWYLVLPVGSDAARRRWGRR